MQKENLESGHNGTILKNEPVVQVELITPTMAVHFLAKNKAGNRPIRSMRVRMWSARLQKGQWKLTHQGIAFDVDGYLIDGQHRLTAIVATGIAVKMMVARGLDRTAFEVMDQGAARSASDIVGLSYRHTSALRCSIALEKGLGVHFRLHLDNADIVDRLRKGDSCLANLERLLHKKVQVGSRAFFTAPTYAALNYAYAVAPQMIDDFTEKIATGELLTRTDPAYVLREWFLKHRKSEGMDRWGVMMATLQAFHHTLFPGERQLSFLISGESGYRAVTAERRSRNLPETPSIDVVPSVSKKQMQFR